MWLKKTPISWTLFFLPMENVTTATGSYDCLSLAPGAPGRSPHPFLPPTSTSAVQQFLSLPLSSSGCRVSSELH